MENIDYEEALKKLMGTNFIRYRGCLIWKTNGGFSWNLCWYSREEAAKSAIDESFDNIKNSYKRSTQKSYLQRFKFWLLGK